MANSSAAEGAPVSTGDAPLNATSQNFLEAPSDVDVNVTESNGTGLPDSVSNNTEAACLGCNAKHFVLTGSTSLAMKDDAQLGHVGTLINLTWVLRHDHPVFAKQTLERCVT